MSHDLNASLDGEAVRFCMHGLHTPLQVAIDAQALQRYFGAEADPDSWVPAYVANFRVIHAVAQLESQERGERLILRTTDFSEAHIRQLRDIDTR